MDRLQGGHEEQHTYLVFSVFFFSVFLQQLAQDLSGPHIDERSNTKKRRLQEEIFDEGHNKMTKYCQVKGECKKNRTVGTCNECSKLLCGKCTAKTVRLCVKCSSSQ